MRTSIEKLLKETVKIVVILLFAMSSLLLVSCSSRVMEKNYFQLADDLHPSSAQTSRTTNQIMFIEPIEVASFLDKNGIVLQTDNIKYTTASNNLWVAPLSEQLEERVVQDLTQLLPNYLITSKPMLTPNVKVKLFIDGFYGSYTGNAVIKGRWVVTNSNGELHSKTFNRNIPLAGDGYDALVKALSKGWQDEERDFVNKMKF